MSDTAEDVERALTLSGAQLCEAILRRHKRVENRKFAIAPGWYALHVGKKVHPILRRADHQAVAQQSWWPDFPKEESLDHGVIVGLFHVAGTAPLRERRAAGDIWAVGPVCNVIDEVIRLRKPIRSVLGALSLWELREEERSVIREQLRAVQLPEATSGDDSSDSSVEDERTHTPLPMKGPMITPGPRKVITPTQGLKRPLPWAPQPQYNADGTLKREAWQDRLGDIGPVRLKSILRPGLGLRPVYYGASWPYHWIYNAENGYEDEEPGKRLKTR